MSVQIQWRRDTAANWTSANPILASGEAGYETDTGKLKIGDGTTAWNSLAYYTATAYNTIQEEGSNLTQRLIMNFIGSGITAEDNSTNTRTNITLDALLNSIADLTATSGTLELTGTDTVGTYTVTTFAKTYLDDTNVTNTRSTLGLGSAATQATTVFLQVANNLSDLNSTSTARTNLGLGTVATKATTDFLQVANNLSDLNNTATARTNLGLGTVATKATTDFLQVSNNLSDVLTAATARTNLGLGTAATKATTDFLQVANNLSDLNNTATARSNINAQVGIAFQDESVTTGTTGAITTVNFVGGGVNVTAASNVLTVSVSSGSGDVTSASTIGDNRLVRGDGGGKGIQESTITVDDSNNMTGVADIEASSLYTTGNITTDGNLAVNTAITMTGGTPYIAGVSIIEFNGTGVISSGNATGETLALRAQDTDGGVDVDFITLTSNNTPTCDLADSVTKNGANIPTAATSITADGIVVGDDGAKGIKSTTVYISSGNSISGLQDIYASGDLNLTGTANIGNTLNITGYTFGTIGVYDAHIINSSGAIYSDTATGATYTFSAYDVDGAAYTNFITFTANNTPTCDLADSVTKAGQYIYRAGGTNVAVADGGTGADDATNARSNLNAQVAIAFQDEGTITGTTGAINTVNFVGAGVNATAASNVLTVTISGGGATGYQTVQEEGSCLTQRTTLNFIGSAVTAADDAGNTRTNVTMDAMVNSLADQTATSGTLEITGTDTLGTYTVTTFAKTYLDDTNVTNTRSTLGLGSAATQATTVFLQVANNLSDVQTAATARTNLGLGTAATKATTDFLQVANNLSDVQTAATARTNLGLGTAATKATTDFLQVTSNLSDVQTAATARGNLGAASTSQTQEYIAGLIPTPTAKDYPLVIKMPHAGTITTAYAKSASGTGTATFKVGSTALGGGANSVSSTISTVSHSTTNTFAVGDTITLTMSGVSSLSDMNFTLQYTRTYS